MRKMAVLLVLTALAWLPQTLEKPQTLAVDPKQSKLEIQVYREGFLKAFGHDHLISAAEFSSQVHLREPDIGKSSVAFLVETRSLRVVDPGESDKDRQEVQSTMLGEKVLDAAKFPRIQFTSTAVRAKPEKDGQTDLQIEGTLNLHGVEKPVVVPLRLRRNAAGITADGELSLLQTDYGITPVKVGGGAVRVKDKLKISFHMVAGADH
jgi:polyisoprenoid-binding protein YceI